MEKVQHKKWNEKMVQQEQRSTGRERLKNEKGAI